MKMLRLVVLLSFPSFVFCSCPTGTAYESTFNKCYAYVSNPAGYLVAEEYCISLGGHLVSIDSAFENTYLVGFAAGAQSHWIGLNYLMYPSWFWSDNSTSQFRAWGASSPADISVYQCAAVSHATNYWTKELCSSPRPFVCAVKPTNITPASTPAPTNCHSVSCPSDYTIFQGNCKCFKFIEKEMNHTFATNYCQKDVANLAKVESAEVNKFLLKLSHKGEGFPMIGLMCPSSKPSECVWADGTYLTGYSNFSPQFPSGYVPVTVLHDGDGLWMTVSEYENSSFFCEKDAVPN